MTLDPAKLLDDIATLKKMLDIEHAARVASEQRAANAEARATGLEAEVRNSTAEIEALKLTIAKMRRDRFGSSSERGAKLLDQLELQLAELEASVAQDAATVEIKAPPATDTEDKQRLKPAPPATAWTSAARARGAFRADGLPLLRWGPQEVG